MVSVGLLGGAGNHEPSTPLRCIDRTPSDRTTPCESGEPNIKSIRQKLVEIVGVCGSESASAGRGNYRNVGSIRAAGRTEIAIQITLARIYDDAI